MWCCMPEDLLSSPSTHISKNHGEPATRASHSWQHAGCQASRKSVSRALSAMLVPVSEPLPPPAQQERSPCPTHGYPSFPSALVTCLCVLHHPHPFRTHFPTSPIKLHFFGGRSSSSATLPSMFSDKSRVFHTRKKSVSVSYCCCNKWPQIWWLKTPPMSLPIVLLWSLGPQDALGVCPCLSQPLLATCIPRSGHPSPQPSIFSPLGSTSLFFPQSWRLNPGPRACCYTVPYHSATPQPSTSVLKGLVGQCWVHLDNPGSSPHLKILSLVTSARSILPFKVIDSQGLGVRIWTCLVRRGAFTESTPNAPNS